MMLGEGNLLRIIRGQFYNPKVDERIFMFLDLRGSTTIAEELGHLKYSQLIQDCFYDLAVVHEYKANIYQYVGDEAVLEWRAIRGKESMNCIKTFFAFQNQIQKKSKYYLHKYNLIPEFKAGMNLGDVTIAEVGDLKREIAFHGDTINTAARIQGECNRLNSDLLVSENLLKYLRLEHWARQKLKGQIHLRGKQKPVNIYSIEIAL
jgi:adenylate cyclase